MRALFVLCSLCLCAIAAAQTTYKCTDKAGKVTYSGTECHLIGLTPAGEVADRMNTAPAYKAPPKSSRPATPPAAAPAPKPEAKAAAKAEDEPDPDRRCFRVKTATGYATRCNEKPEEAPAKK